MFKKIIGSSTLSDAPDPLRHERKCLICNHPDRDAIEEEFLHWNSPAEIASRYDVSRDAIYRHAHAGNLFAERAGKMRFALDLIIERADIAKVTGDTIIRAIRAYSCLTDDGHWVEPPREVIVTREERPPVVGDMPAPAEPVDRAESYPEHDEFLIATLENRNDLNSNALNKTYPSNRNKMRGVLKAKLAL